jgi:hypothetical protein
MADERLLQALDYILNHSDEASIEVLAEAVVRRRRNIGLFGAVGEMPDPQRMAKDLTDRIDAGMGSGIEGMRKSIQEMIIRLIREQAPELSDSQVEELCQAWLPDGGGKSEALPRDVLVSMIEQFISFSKGAMRKSVNEDMRKEMGAWPERYWKAFPPVVRQIITDYLKDKITEKDFNSKIAIALDL